MLKVKLLENGKVPSKAHSGDAGFDVFVKEEIIIKSKTLEKIPLGICIEIPEGYVAMIDDKSGVASKGLFTVGGVIDSTYRGEIHCVIWNNSNEDITFNKHQKIAQMIIFPCYTKVDYELVSELSETDRGSGGFGSSGDF